MTHKYKITVGVLGTVHEGTNRTLAFRIYEQFLSDSKKGKGKVGGEGVFLYQNDEIIREYAGFYDEVYR